MRKHGFYWVRIHPLDWEIAKWEVSWQGHEQWSMCGCEYLFDDNELDEIDERMIERPPIGIITGLNSLVD